jgi:hypothetical protein
VGTVGYTGPRRRGRPSFGPGHIPAGAPREEPTDGPCPTCGYRTGVEDVRRILPDGNVLNERWTRCLRLGKRHFGGLPACGLIKKENLDVIKMAELYKMMLGLPRRQIAEQCGLSVKTVHGVFQRAKGAKSESCVNSEMAELVYDACKKIREDKGKNLEQAVVEHLEPDAPAPVAEVQPEPIFVADEAAELPELPDFTEEVQAIRSVLNTQPVFLEEKSPELPARDPWRISFEICQLMHELKQCVGPLAAEQFLELANAQAESSQFRYAR